MLYERETRCRMQINLLWGILTLEEGRAHICCMQAHIQKGILKTNRAAQKTPKAIGMGWIPTVNTAAMLEYLSPNSNSSGTWRPPDPTTLPSLLSWQPVKNTHLKSDPQRSQVWNSVATAKKVSCMKIIREKTEYVLKE